MSNSNENSEISQNHVKYLENQLSLARREINNLRQQLKSLNHVHRKECEDISNKLENWQCLQCRKTQNLENNAASSSSTPQNEQNIFTCSYIGIISTHFPEKRGTPRQPGICPETVGKLILNDTFTNPSHALEGLQEFSHIWILFHFHKNDSTHIRAKVTPPRLNGLRTGVFATRSPHRPTPIGLSLVKIDRIVENCVYFMGVDMIDQTPVIDIKPYIPQYDSPNLINLRFPDDGASSSRRVMDGEENGARNPTLGAVSNENSNRRGDNLEEFIRSNSRIGEREAPDGEEEESPNPQAISQNQTILSTSQDHDEQIRIPSWIDQPPVHTLTVIFKDRALSQLQQFGAEGEEKKVTISNVLREDPRSIYLRERWGSHCYVFRICELYVSCKFDDNSHTVTVYQVFQNAAPECDE